MMVASTITGNNGHVNLILLAGVKMQAIEIGNLPRSLY
jgi:hypothetical protein